jgi:Domain of unknown function (DUF4386)
MELPDHVRDRGLRQLRAVQPSSRPWQCDRNRAEHYGARDAISDRRHLLSHLQRRRGRSAHSALRDSETGKPGSRLGRSAVSFGIRFVVASFHAHFAERVTPFGQRFLLASLRTGSIAGPGRLNIAATFDDYYVGLPFFGLAATVCAWLWLKSNYIPKGLAVFGVISFAWCVLCDFVFLIFPGFAKPLNPYWFDTPMALFELALSFWLLFKGIRAPLAADSTAPPRI